MKRTMTVNLKNIKFISSDIFEQIIKNRRKLLLTVLSVFGLWCGTRIYITESEIISEYFSFYTEIIKNQQISKAYIILLIINILPFLITFKNGLFALGSAVIMFCPCLSGILTGVINAWSYNNFRINGVFFSLLAIIPFAVIINIIIITSSDKSIIVSKTITELLFSDKSGNRGEVKEFFIRQLIIFAFIVAITALQIIVVKLLLNKLLLI